MEIIQKRYPAIPPKPEKKPKKHRLLIVISSVIIAASGSGLYIRAALTKPLPSLSASVSTVTSQPASPPTINWPAGAEAAIGSTTSGIIAQSSATETPRSIASIAKIITAMAVIRQKPISSQDDNMITFSASDEALYNYYVSADGSNTPIKAGDTLSEYRALEAMLLPSSNNMADSLAIWAFGSIDSYRNYANNMVKSFGLTKTTVGEASGFNDMVLSTPSELVVLGQKFMSDPLLAQIVKTQNDNLPVLGTIYNTNMLLGGEITGIKTGHTNGAGYCLLLARDYEISKNHSVTIISVVLGAANASSLFSLSDSLSVNAKDYFGINQVTQKSTVVGTYQAPWGSKSDIITADAVLAYGQKTTTRTTVIKPKKLVFPAKSGDNMGEITTFSDGNIQEKYPLVLKDSLKPPSTWWRLTHYF